MRLNAHQREHIARNFVDARQLPEFTAPNGWLTYYLDASPTVLQQAVPRLSRAGLSNLNGAEGAFLYAKQSTVFEEAAIISKIEDIAALCDDLGVNLGHVDLDTCDAVERSNFHCLLHLDDDAQTH